jgi:hypothetical protein
LYIFTPFFTVVNIVEPLLLQIYVLKREILQFLAKKSSVYNREWLVIKTSYNAVYYGNKNRFTPQATFWHEWLAGLRPRSKIRCFYVFLTNSKIFVFFSKNKS